MDCFADVGQPDRDAEQSKKQYENKGNNMFFGIRFHFSSFFTINIFGN